MSAVVFQLRNGRQSVSVGDARGLRSRLTERNLAEHELGALIGDAVWQAEEVGEDGVVVVTDDQRPALIVALAAEKTDRGLTAELSELEKLAAGK